MSLLVALLAVFSALGDTTFLLDVVEDVGEAAGDVTGVSMETIPIVHPFVAILSLIFFKIATFAGSSLCSTQIQMDLEHCCF